jgi:hypothetical protein
MTWRGRKRLDAMTSRSVANVIEAFLELRAELAHVLGVQTVDMLIDRSITEIRAAHPQVRAISVDDELNVESLEMAFVNSTTEEAQAAINALVAVMLLILARLLGKRVAESLADQVNKSELFQAIRL